MLLRRLLAALATVLALAAAPLGAQDQATLVSDRLDLTGGSTLVASGNVEVFFQGRRLRASRITYDQATDRLTIEGPIVLTDATGEVLILASQADLAADLTEGILTSARMVLNQQLQLAANRMTRVEGRYTALDQVVASSCKVCAARPTPLWEIRARRVIHDQEERQLYFDHASFRVAGMPVFYVPRLRMPDPTLARATGFLMPSLRTTSTLGTGLKFPYFITLGPSRDLTLTPYLTTKGARSLEFRYRQAYRTGDITLAGALTTDETLPGKTRGYLDARGAFALPDGFRLTFGLQAASDNAYPLDYAVLGSDRLDSRIELSRITRNGYFSARIISFQSLRDEDDNATLPGLVTDVTFQRRFSLGPLGGEGGLVLQSHSHLRTSSDPADGPDPDLIADGRDLSRLSARLDWRRSLVFGPGIEATILGEATADAYAIAEDAAFSGKVTRTHAVAGLELRWPWVKVAPSGATHVIEPVVQLLWAGRSGAALPNEDSALVEFDEGNLFALGRFPGSDAVEKGARANIGIGWTRHDPDGWSLGLTAGRVFREQDFGQFGPASGLAGRSSDWLVAASIDWQGSLVATGRVALDDTFAPTKAEARLTLNRERLAIATSALWARADPGENRTQPTREFTFDARWRATDALTAKFSGSYDFVADRGTVAGMGVEFRNECVAVDLSLSRRFTSSTSVSPTTDFALSVELIGFGSGQKPGPSGQCR
jgi:LPS-assembly protein